MWMQTLLTLRANYEEDKILGLRNDLPTLLDRDQGNDTSGTTLGILYNFLFKVIITLRGLDSYTT
jgi:hypothetical protein